MSQRLDKADLAFLLDVLEQCGEANDGICALCGGDATHDKTCGIADAIERVEAAK